MRRTDLTPRCRFQPGSRWLWLAALVCLLLSLSLPAAAQSSSPQTLSEVDFWALVKRTRTTADSVAGWPAAEAAPELLALANEWEALNQVQLDDGQTVAIETYWLAELLRRDPPEAEVVRSAADWLQNGKNLRPYAFMPADAGQRLQRILARAEFQWESAESSWAAKLWQRFWNMFFEWLDRLFGGRSLNLASPLVASIQWIALALGLLLVGLLIGFVLRKLRRSFAAAAELPETGPDGQALTAASALQNADALSLQGDYRRAVRFLYLSALLALDEAGLLRYDRTRTNREYLRSLRSQPELLGLLGEVVEVFDRVWYGFQPISPDDYTHYSQRIAQLQERRQR